jgi:solute carrier family 25 (mitochondrial phosphate transporter), member 23/24/25/41
LKVAAGFTPSVPLFLGYGTIAGMVSQLAVHPIDMVRRNVQASSQQIFGWRAVTSQVAHIWTRDGVRGFYRGWLPTMLKVAPSVGVSLLARDAALGRL